MNDKIKQKLNKHFKEMTGRNPSKKHEGNLFSNSHLLLKSLVEVVEELEKRIDKLERS